MKMLLVKTNFYYHSHIWPEAQAGSTRWFPPDKYEQLIHDRPNCFSILEVKDVGEVKSVNPYPQLEDTNRIDTSWLEEAQDGEETKTLEETPGVLQGSVKDSEKDGRVKRTRKRYPRKQNKECVESG